MEDEVEYLCRIDILGTSAVEKAGVLRGRCPYCNERATFRQIGQHLESSKITEETLALQCEGCSSIVAFSIPQEKFYPAPMLKGLDFHLLS